MKTIKKISLYIVLFLIVFGVSLFTKLPAYFDSYIFYEEYRIEAHALLIVYRLLIYIVFPIVVSFIEKRKNRGIKYSYLLIENFNLQFSAYSLLSGTYVIVGLDRILGVSLFGVSEVFVFVTGFILTVMLKKEIPELVYSNEES